MGSRLGPADALLGRIQLRCHVGFRQRWADGIPTGLPARGEPEWNLVCQGYYRKAGVEYTTPGLVMFRRHGAGRSGIVPEWVAYGPLSCGSEAAPPKRIRRAIGSRATASGLAMAAKQLMGAQHCGHVGVELGLGVALHAGVESVVPATRLTVAKPAEDPKGVRIQGQNGPPTGEQLDPLDAGRPIPG